MNVLFGVIVAIVSLIAGLFLIDRFGKMPNIKKADVDKSLGEYGKLKAELEDIVNPYSGHKMLSSPVDWIITGSVVIPSVFIYESVSDEYTISTGILVSAIYIILASMVAVPLIRGIKTYKVKKKMSEWRKSHPGVQTDK